jgi:hypothetical protein
MYVLSQVGQQLCDLLEGLDYSESRVVVPYIPLSA